MPNVAPRSAIKAQIQNDCDGQDFRQSLSLQSQQQMEHVSKHGVFRRMRSVMTLGLAVMLIAANPSMSHAVDLANVDVIPGLNVIGKFLPNGESEPA